MNSKFGKDSRNGKMIITRAVVSKVLGIDAMVYYNAREKFPWLFGITHSAYGKVDVKYSHLNSLGRSEVYKFQTRKINKRTVYKRECDTYFFVGFDHDWKNIEDVFIVPNKGWIKDIGTASVYRNANDSKYNEFRVDAKPYNDAYHDLVLFIGSSMLVGIDDVKKWLECESEEKEKVVEHE